MGCVPKYEIKMKNKNQLNKDIIPKFKSILEKLIFEQRSQMIQICLISGAIAAFLMPVYISKDFPLSQHVLIALALVCFLLTILISSLYLSFKILDEQRKFVEMIDILESDDAVRADKFCKKMSKPLKWKKSIDTKTLMVDILFSLGLICLILSIVLFEINKK